MQIVSLSHFLWHSQSLFLSLSLSPILTARVRLSVFLRHTHSPQSLFFSGALYHNIFFSLISVKFSLSLYYSSTISYCLSFNLVLFNSAPLSLFFFHSAPLSMFFFLFYPCDGLSLSPFLPFTLSLKHCLSLFPFSP